MFRNSKYKRLGLVILSCATFLTIIYSARGIFISVSQGRPVDWIRQVGFEFLYWYIWALFAPVVILFATRFPIRRSDWRRAVVLLVLFGLVIAPLQATVEFSIAYSIDLLRNVDAAEMARRRAILSRAIVVESFSNFIIYALIISGHYAFEYYRKYRERETRSIELEGRLAQAELQNLKMQLQPHFLFNTLHTISVLMMRDTSAANRMLVRLSDLLRITLDNTGTQSVSLKQELEFLSGYLEIEQTRFQDRLKVLIDVPSATLDAQVPNLILQPLVENAIRHGIANRTGAGTIRIEASIKDDQLHLVVSDDGAGVNKSALPLKKGIGLKNTEARLRQLYGAAHNFEISSLPSGGLKVLIAIPVQYS